MNDRMLEEEYIIEDENLNNQKAMEKEIDDLRRAPVEIDWIDPEVCMPKTDEDCIFKVAVRGEHSGFHDDVFIVTSGFYCGETDHFRILDQTGYSYAVIPPNQVIGWRYIEVGTV